MSNNWIKEHAEFTAKQVYQQLKENNFQLDEDIHSTAAQQRIQARKSSENISGKVPFTWRGLMNKFSGKPENDKKTYNPDVEQAKVNQIRQSRRTQDDVYKSRTINRLLSRPDQDPNRPKQNLNPQGIDPALGWKEKEEPKNNVPSDTSASRAGIGGRPVQQPPLTNPVAPKREGPVTNTTGSYMDPQPTTTSAAAPTPQNGPAAAPAQKPKPRPAGDPATPIRPSSGGAQAIGADSAPGYGRDKSIGMDLSHRVNNASGFVGYGRDKSGSRNTQQHDHGTNMFEEATKKVKKKLEKKGKDKGEKYVSKLCSVIVNPEKPELTSFYENQEK